MPPLTNDQSSVGPIQEGNPDDVDEEVFNQGGMEVDNLDAVGLFVPALPPMEEFDDAADAFLFGEFEYAGEMDEVVLRHISISIRFCEVVQIE